MAFWIPIVPQFTTVGKFGLSTFLQVAKLQSFSKAAKVLGYSQAAVTIQIKQLEQELGVHLFDRIGKQTSLTHQGSVFS